MILSWLLRHVLAFLTQDCGDGRFDIWWEDDEDEQAANV